MIEAIASLYMPAYPTTLVYMLQSTEYQIGPYLKWYWRTQNFARVANRRQLKVTRVTRLLHLILIAGMAIQVAVGLVLVYFGYWRHLTGGVYFGVALVVGYPVVWAHLAVVPLLLGRIFIIKPAQQRQRARAEKIFKAHPAVKLAIAGSYGKTSMKEILLAVLSEGKKVAATPANKNVGVAHAQFAAKLTGNEDILIIEYGEGAPGDVARLARLTRPTHAVITGLAPAHLDRYRTLHAAGVDIFSVVQYVPKGHVFVNTESSDATAFMKPDYSSYDQTGALGWKISDVSVNLEGTNFTLKKGKTTLKLHSSLLGRHQLGPLSLAAALAHQFGLSDKQIIAGIAKTTPFEHRMQPYHLAGAWVIDDTYNGNLEGIRVGTQLLKELSANRRKIYVTPGLVDQGPETKRVHIEMGQLIASATPNLVVLMQNSVTAFIRQGLEAAGYKGELMIENNPLNFYTNLDQFLAVGDVVLMQNDWPDNYT